MTKKKHIPKEVVEIKQIKFDRLKKASEIAVKQNDPKAEQLVEDLVKYYVDLGSSISDHYVPKIKELNKTIKKLKGKKKRK